jgi:hypothetical protein
MRMSPEERAVLRERENLRRERIRRETETALHDSGLRLDQEKRALFEIPLHTGAAKNGATTPAANRN